MLSANPLQTAQKIADQALQLSENHKYASSITLWKQAILIYQQQKQWAAYVNTLNKLGNDFSNLATYQQALTTYHKALQVGIKKLGENHEFVAHACHNLGLTYSQQGSFNQSFSFFKKALAIKIHCFGETHSKIADTYHSIGWSFYKEGRYNRAIEYHLKAKTIWQRLEGEPLNDLASIYNHLGLCYREKGDYTKAIHYYEQSLAYRLQSKGAAHPSVAITYQNMGMCHVHKLDYTKALAYYQKALDIRTQALGETHSQTAISHHSIGHCYTELKQNAKALPHFEKAEAIYLKNLGPEHIYTSNLYNILGLCYLQQKAFEKALFFLKKALTIRVKKYGNQHPIVARSYQCLGDYFAQKKQFNTALSHIEKAIFSLVPDFEKQIFLKKEAALEGKASIGLFDLLALKAQFLFKKHQQSQNPADLQAAFESYEFGDQLIAHIRRSYRADGSKLVLAQKTKRFYEYAIQTALTLAETLPLQEAHFLEKAFAYSEKSKAILLLSNIKNADAMTTSDIPADLLEQEKDLRLELNFLAKKIGEEKLKIKDNKYTVTTSEQLRQYQQTFFTQNQTYEALIERFEKDYPTYFQLKYDLASVPLAQVQAVLKKNQVLLKFFIGQEKIYLFKITDQQLRILQSPKPDDFEDLIEEFTEAIDDLSRKAYIRAAYELYSLLFGKTLDSIRLCPTTKTPANHLIIIPDEQLHLLPFESLLTCMPSRKAAFKNLPYLLRQGKVSYHYSATLYHYGKQVHAQKPAIANSFLGIAPVYADASNSTTHTPTFLEKTQNTERSLRVFGTAYKELLYSKQEVVKISHLFQNLGYPNHILLHEQATSPNFKQQVGTYKFVHIAAHGIFNHQNPEMSGIIFSPIGGQKTANEAVFYIADAYHLKLQADLVVLSSCESGIGKLATGEGMIAINRGFLHAGAQNILYTLFKVYDKATSQLTHTFYQHVLQKNLCYAEALRQAKLTLIEQDMPPKYWSGFVLVGN